MYKSKTLVSISMEIINTNAKSILVGCIYRNPVTEVNWFNEHFLGKYN